jgi:hypothetical protein
MQKITLVLSESQTAVFDGLYNALAQAPKGTVTHAQVLWPRDGVCELEFALLAAPFASIIRDIAQLPGSRVPFAEPTP